MEHEGGGDTICNWRTQHSNQRIGKRIGELGNKRTNGDHPSYSIVQIGIEYSKET